MGKKEKRLVESVLFSASKPVSMHNIKEATKLSTKKIELTLDELITDYNIERKNDTSMEIIKAGDKFAMQIKKTYADQSLKIASPDIQDNMLKTLSLIAFHQPIKQSNLRRMVGQKIYEHVDELVFMKLVNSKKHGSTEMLTTTNQFPEYFGIESTKPEDIRDFLVKKVTESISNNKTNSQ